MKESNREERSAAYAEERQTQPAAAAKRRRPALRRTLIVLTVVLLVGAICLAAVSIRNDALYRKVQFTYTGTLHRECIYALQSDEDAVQQELDHTKRNGQTQKFTYFGTDTLLLSAPYAYGAIVFGSPASNDCTLIFSILDENGTMVYRSGGILPGYYVSNIRLSSEMTAGTHRCRLYVTGYNTQTYALVGVQYSDLTVQIGG